jgi:hypothetical protein
VRKVCAVCPAEFEAKRAAARYCSERCKKRAQRQPGRRPERHVAVSGGVVAAVEAELAAAGRLGSSAGQSALVLARRIDAGDAETVAGLAAAVKQLGATLADAVKDGRVRVSPLDELRAVRERKRAAG